jgi:ABC-type uncharacterized transport system substrate-binding protein
MGSAVAWPLAARAQRAAMPVIGFLSSLSGPWINKRISSFSQGLIEIGLVVGKDVTIDLRMAEGNYDRLPDMAADLVNSHASLITAWHPRRRSLVRAGCIAQRAHHHCFLYLFRSWCGQGEAHSQ